LTGFLTHKTVTRLAVLWAVFFFIGLCLGYPTLNRYDPKQTGLADTRYYTTMVEQDLSTLSHGHWRYRVLTPLMAKPVYKLAQGRIGSWNPAFFALLVINSAFCAATAVLLTVFGLKLFGDMRAGLLGAFLFLTNFNVPNLYLSGLVDASEVFFLGVVAWTLFHRKWLWLPLLGVAGGLARETFVPFSGALFGGWYLAERWYRDRPIFSALCGAVMVFLGLVTVFLVRFLVSGVPEMPWDTASSEIPSLTRIVTAMSDTLFNRNLLYTFAVLIPLGIPGLRGVPKGWVTGSACAALLALVLGAGAGAGDNIGRPLFSAMGLVLTVSAAGFLWRFLEPGNEERR